MSITVLDLQYMVRFGFIFSFYHHPFHDLIAFNICVYHYYLTQWGTQKGLNQDLPLLGPQVSTQNIGPICVWIGHTLGCLLVHFYVKLKGNCSL